MGKFLFMALLLAITTFAGCGTSPKANFYVLSSGTTAERTEVQAAYTVVVGPVTVPEVVDRPQFVTRANANQVMINEFERWAAPLRSEIPRVIADNLMQLLNGAHVFAYPQNISADYRVLIDVQRFDSTLGDAAAVEVLWTVRSAKGSELKSGRSIAREAVAGPGYDALVSAHNRALAAVSRDIAAAIHAARQ